MPIGIFLFARKPEFQKSEKNGEKRRKPEKISGFSVGIFFVNTCWRHHPEFRALREDSHTLRLASELADLRVANANRIRRSVARLCGETGAWDCSKRRRAAKLHRTCSDEGVAPPNHEKSTPKGCFVV